MFEVAYNRAPGQLPSGYSQASGLPIVWDGSAPALPDRSLSRAINLALKRLTDLVLSGLAVLFLGPLLLIVAALIKLTSDGPVLFVQPRAGYHGKTFMVFKFRTMHGDRCDAEGNVQAFAGDDRITPIGRFLRKTSIDELPQLLNVLAGDMSLVGPRPYPLGMLAAGRPYAEIEPYFDFRYSMKPGLSGWAQANGFRGPTDVEHVARIRLLHDVAYVQQFSWALDFRIILLTLWREFSGGTGL